MKAFAIDELGRRGSLHDLPDPEPAEGQVRIRVAAAGVNPFDNAVLQGFLKDRMEHRFRHGCLGDDRYHRHQRERLVGREPGVRLRRQDVPR